MSLRLRTLIAVILVLLIGSLAGIMVGGWRAKQTLREELVTAVAGARQAATGGLQDLPASSHPAHDLHRLVAAFNGDRHVQAILRDEHGDIVFRSRPLTAKAAPTWFQDAFLVPIRTETLSTRVSGYGGLELRPVFGNDVAALWAEFIGLVVVLMASLVIGSIFVWLTVGPALRPLSDFTAAFLRIGSGDYDVRVKETGPVELVRLGRAVNQMTTRLHSMQTRNQALERQLVTLQEEERADLARDLHDEIGPQLFAANVDAAMIRRLMEEGRGDQGLDQVKAIQGAVAQMQILVRDILGRLRPTELVELGLSAAIAELVEFWRSRRPGIHFEMCLAPDDRVPRVHRETLYRVVQEGLNNAVRHGRPHAVSVNVSEPRAGWVVAKIDDDGAHAGTPGPAGFGLIGMRERVAKAGGELTIDKGAPGRGWTVVARLPWEENEAVEEAIEARV